MKGPHDLAAGMLEKARSDLNAAKSLLSANIAFDAACFHAQQAAEKSLKAFPAAKQIPFPFTHNLSKLLILCSAVDPSFTILEAQSDSLTPYAVEARYDDEFWPSAQETTEAIDAAISVFSHVSERIPTYQGLTDPTPSRYSPPIG